MLSEKSPRFSTSACLHSVPTFLPLTSVALHARASLSKTNRGLTINTDTIAHHSRRVLPPTCRDFYLGGKQIKLLGEGACVILCADGADVEARTYGTWGLVSSSPASPRASVFCSVS